MNYYNEWDKGAAAWLRELIKAGLIPNGYVDDRSITDVKPSDLEGFTQCHFFCGIAGWPLALAIAGIPATVPLWTGSPPCQPFSVAGAGAGKRDSRHLAPAFLDLVAECRPQLIFGEQVAAAVTKDQWADSLLIELAEEGYASGFTVLPACSVGAPHKRDRLFFGAQLLEHTSAFGRNAWRNRNNSGDDGQQPAAACKGGCMADTDDARPQGRGGMPERADQQPFGASGLAGSMANTGSECERQNRMPATRDGCLLAGRQETPAAHTGLCGDCRPNAHNSFWSDADWLGCRDGKFRPVESGTFPLANGIPARVGRLRGYGNAIVPQVAAEFIKAFRGACGKQ